jgi:type II secretory pathway pseudopilin PulG
MSYNSLHSNKKQTRQSDGFGLVELLVSVSIMMLVLSVILTRQSVFNGSVLLRDQVYEVALTVREVQLNAVSAIGVGGGSGTEFRTLLGVHFDTNTENISDKTYPLFRDDNGNHRYDGAGEQYGQQQTLDSRFEVRAVKTDTGTLIPGGKLTVIFQRPNFDARFYDASGNIINTSRVQIEISKRGETANTDDVRRILEITSTGQITVQ